MLHLAIRHIRRLSDELTAAYGADCPVAVVSRATQPSELILRGTLADIADQVERAGLRQAAVIMVGRVLKTADFVESHLYSDRQPLVAARGPDPGRGGDRPAGADDQQTAHVDQIGVEVAQGGHGEPLVRPADAAADDRPGCSRPGTRAGSPWPP